MDLGDLTLLPELIDAYAHFGLVEFAPPSAHGKPCDLGLVRGPRIFPSGPRCRRCRRYGTAVLLEPI